VQAQVFIQKEVKCDTLIPTSQFQDVHWWLLLTIRQVLGSNLFAGSAILTSVFVIILSLPLSKLVYMFRIVFWDVLPSKIIVYKLFKNSVRTSKRTLHLIITTINWLMLLKEIITVCTENHSKHMTTRMQHY
jgi:hypothetical protein